MLLGSYFSQHLLATYCIRRLGKTGKGGVGTLASRIAREWARKDFVPLVYDPATFVAPVVKPNVKKVKPVVEEDVYEEGEEEEQQQEEEEEEEEEDEQPPPAKKIKVASEEVSDVNV